MLSTVKNAVARFFRRPKSLQVPLNLEAMETRLMPSVAPAVPAAPVTGSVIKVREEAPIAPDNSGGGITIAPERPVYGYKHRKRWPFEIGTQPVPTIAPRVFRTREGCPLADIRLVERLIYA